MLWCLIFLSAGLWQEYGLEKTEQIGAVTAHRFKDPTGAYAAFQWQRPEGKVAVTGNYLLKFTTELSKTEVEAIAAKLPGLVRSSPSPLVAYLPEKNKIPKSERYVLGPESLAQFEPRISPQIAAFDKGAEAQIARYKLGANEVQLVIFLYPTPQLAMERLKHFQALEGSVRRTGPLLLAAFPASAATDTLLAAVKYEPKFTWAEIVTSDTPQDAARMILAIFVVAGVLIGSSVLLGLVFGGFRIALGRFGIQTADHSLTTLKINAK